MTERAFDPTGQLAKAVFDASDIGMIVLDPHGTIVLWNAWMIAASRLSRDTAIGATIIDLFPELTGTRVCQAIDEALRHGMSAVLSQTLHTAPFPLYPVSATDDEARLQQMLSIQPLTCPGIPRHCFIQIVDVTETTRRECLLRAQAHTMQSLATDYQMSAMRTHAILDSAMDGILTIDEHGIVETYNPAAERLFGYTPDEVIGQNIKMLMPEPCQRAHDGYIRNYLQSGHAKVIGIGREVTGKRQDGTCFPMELCVSEMQLDGRYMFVGVIRDITERKKIDQLKNEFVSTVSHELRTPLTSIRGSLGLIAGGAVGELPAQAQSLVEIAHNNSERLVLLINDILDIEKIESGKMDFQMQPCDIAALVEQALEANRAYGDQYSVTFVLTQTVPDTTVEADHGRLLQVLTNLLSNAAKFSPFGANVEVAVTRQDDVVRVAINDHGPGIPAEFRNRIFQKFAQADASDTRQKGGTGLGLSICKAIIEHHGGHIDFKTGLPDEGSTFYFELPVRHGVACVTARA